MAINALYKQIGVCENNGWVIYGLGANTPLFDSPKPSWKIFRRCVLGGIGWMILIEYPNYKDLIRQIAR